MTDDDLDRRCDERPLVRVDFPAGDGPLEAVALLTLDRPEALNALSFALVAQLDDAARGPRRRPGLPRDRDHRRGRAGRSPPGADIRELAGRDRRASCGRRTRSRRWTGSGTWTRRSSPRSAGSRWAVAASWRWPATCWSPATTPSSASRRSSSA